MPFQAIPTPKFAPHYHAWGPQSSATPPTLSAAQQYCKQLACLHYENFSIVSWLLPKHLQQHFYNIYAFCRWSDDLGDELEVTSETTHPLTWWRELTTHVLDGSPTHPVHIALQETILTYKLPLVPFLDLISAFEQDQSQKTYADFAQLLNYCARSANPVGKIILYLAECPTPENLSYSDSICTGLQLANFWQDVRRDYEINRIYLPQEDLRKYGVDLHLLPELTHTPEFAQLIEFQVERAKSYLENGALLLNNVPHWLKYDLKLFQRGGLAILNKIAQNEYRVFAQRPKLSKLDFLKISLYSLWR